MEVLTPPHRKTSWGDSTFATPDLTTFARLDALGLQVTGQFLEPDRAVLACRVLDRDPTCGRCSQQGLRDSTTRRLAHEPLGWRPTILLVTVCRFRCAGCGYVWQRDTPANPPSHGPGYP